MDTLIFIMNIIILPRIALTMNYNNFMPEEPLPFKPVIVSIINNYFKRDLHFLVVVSLNSTQPELFEDVLSHVHRNNSVPVLTLENFTGRSTFNHDSDDEEYEEEEEEETETSTADNDYEEIDYNIEEEHDFTPLKRVDTGENSVGFIFFVREVTDRCFVDSDFTNSPFWNSRAFILLVITEPVGQEPDTIVKMFQGCWDKHSILNLAVVCERNISPRREIHSMTPLQDHITELQILSYNPFINKDNINIIHINGYTIRHLSRVFPTKTIDIHGYPINVKETNFKQNLWVKYDSNGTVHLEGIDGIFANIVLERINASFSLIPIRKGDHFGRLFSEGSKNILGTMVLAIKRVLGRMMYPHEQSCITIVVPKALPLPKYLNIILPFTKFLWVAYILFTITIIFIWIILSGYDILDKDGHFRAGDVALEIFRILFSGGTERQPKYFVQRFFIFWCFLYSLIISNAYQGSLTSYLTEEHFYSDINTLVEARDTELKIAVIASPDDLDDLKGEAIMEDEFLVSLLPRLRFFSNETEALEMVALHRNIGKIVDVDLGRIEMSKPYFYKNGYPMVHIIDECYFRFPVCYVVISKNSPFLSRLNVLTVRLSEGGFISKWRKHYIILSSISSRKMTRGKEPVVISLEHLQAPFYLLLIGVFSSFILFLFELFSMKSRRDSIT